MGIGPLEFGLVIVMFVLLFGPGAVLVWWLVTHANATRDATASGPGDAPFVGEPAHDPALEAARERYARGEIGRDEFEEIKSTLGH